MTLRVVTRADLYWLAMMCEPHTCGSWFSYVHELNPILFLDLLLKFFWDFLSVLNCSLNAAEAIVLN